MKQTIIFLFIIFILISCNQKRHDEFDLKAIEFNRKACEYFKEANYDSAFVYYDKAIAVDSNYYLPHINKAEIYLLEKEYELALEECELSLKKKPELAEGWTFAGMLYDFLGVSEKAMSCYLKSIEIYDSRICDPEKSHTLETNKLNKAITLLLIENKKLSSNIMTKQQTSHFDSVTVDSIFNTIIYTDTK